MPVLEDDATIQERFEHFHVINPQVYRMLVALAREWRSVRPKQRVGIARLFEYIRWEIDVRINPSGDGFKLNNNFRSRYARLIMEQEPDLADVFEIREIRSE